MKKVIISIIILICGAALFWVMKGVFSKSTSEITGDKSVTFKLIKTYGTEKEPKDALLSSVRGAETDNMKNIYAMDNDERIISFTPDGGIRWIINKKGNGPGDISQPSGYTTDGVKYLYIANISGTRIDKLDLEGKYISSFNVSAIQLTSISIVGLVKPNMLVTAKSIMGTNAKEIFILDTDNNFKIQNKFTIYDIGDFKIASNASLGFDVRILDDKIVTGSVIAYRMKLYDVNGKEIKEIKRDIKNLFLSYAKDNTAAVAGEIRAPIKINNSYYLSVLLWPTNITEANQLLQDDYKKDYSTSIDIFNEAGDLIYSQKTKGMVNPKIGNPIYSDSEGYLYTFKEMPYPQICKYQVIISDKK